ncbi:hypothetical protein MKEN_01310300 [Mycena kentingensis (nom. inval.)]|nr:hypothetical protein MKEN_01310300 [Mycena kentingensis (nom. inval.)]
MNTEDAKRTQRECVCPPLFPPSFTFSLKDGLARGWSLLCSASSNKPAARHRSTRSRTCFPAPPLASRSSSTPALAQAATMHPPHAVAVAVPISKGTAHPSPSPLASSRPAHSAPPPVARGRTGAASASTPAQAYNPAHQHTQLAALLSFRPSTRDLIAGIAPHVLLEVDTRPRMHMRMRSRRPRSRVRSLRACRRSRSRSRSRSASPSPSPSPSRRRRMRESPLRRAVVPAPGPAPAPAPPSDALSEVNLGLGPHSGRDYSHSDVGGTDRSRGGRRPRPQLGGSNADAGLLYAPHKAIFTSSPDPLSPPNPKLEATGAEKSTPTPKPAGPGPGKLRKSAGFRIDKVIRSFILRNK